MSISRSYRFNGYDSSSGKFVFKDGNQNEQTVSKGAIARHITKLAKHNTDAQAIVGKGPFKAWRLRQAIIHGKPLIMGKIKELLKDTCLVDREIKTGSGAAMVSSKVDVRGSFNLNKPAGQQRKEEDNVNFGGLLPDGMQPEFETQGAYINDVDKESTNKEENKGINDEDKGGINDEDSNYLFLGEELNSFSGVDFRIYGEQSEENWTDENEQLFDPNQQVDSEQQLDKLSLLMQLDLINSTRQELQSFEQKGGDSGNDTNPENIATNMTKGLLDLAEQLYKSNSTGAVSEVMEVVGNLMVSMGANSLSDSALNGALGEAQKLFDKYSDLSGFKEVSNQQFDSEQQLDPKVKYEAPPNQELSPNEPWEKVLNLNQQFDPNPQVDSNQQVDPNQQFDPNHQINSNADACFQQLQPLPSSAQVDLKQPVSYFSWQLPPFNPNENDVGKESQVDLGSPVPTAEGNPPVPAKGQSGAEPAELAKPATPEPEKKEVSAEPAAPEPPVKPKSEDQQAAKGSSSIKDRITFFNSKIADQ